MAIDYPRSELEEVAAARRRRLARTLAAIAALVAVIVAVSVVISWDGSEGDPGSLTEALYGWDAPLPSFTPVTEAWGLDGWRNTAETEASGGLAIADLNRDGAPDLVVAGGSAVAYLGGGDGFSAINELAEDAVAVDVADVDADGWPDVLLGREAGDDLIVWGDTLLSDAREVLALEGGSPTTGLIAADFDADGLMDVLRLGYGDSRAAPDVIWRQVATRVFEQIELPDSRRRSLAAAVADFDGSGRLDVWVTRDVGWKTGGDSLYVRSRTDPLVWHDRAPEFGTNLEIDGMGVTVADFTGDQLLDVYLSDLGDNELLEREKLFLEPGASNFVKEEGRGLGRIRALDAAEDVISSSWGSGVADLNLDGVLDLVVVNGGFRNRVANKVPGTSVARADPPAFFLGTPSGTWADVWPSLGVDWDGAGRGLALGDLDGDHDTDVVISTRDAGLVVLRNDSDGPALSVAVSAGCDVTGVFINLFTARGPLQVPVAAPSFLGRHGPEFIIGTQGSRLSLPSGDLTRGPPTYTVAGTGREVLELSCSDVGREPLR